MSRENVEVIKRVYERWVRDRKIDPQDFHPSFEIRTPIMELENRTHRGYEGYQAWRDATEDVFADDWFEPDEFRDLGDMVAVIGWLRLKGRISGLEARQPSVQLWTFSEGKPSSMTASRTLEQALEAVGLRE